MRFALIDFETSSSADLKKCGAHVYAADPTTEILCLGVTVDGNEPYVLEPNDWRCWFSDSADELKRAVTDPNVMFVAHNASFEKAVWRNIMVPVYGWPDIPNERWHDIMAVCARKGLPLKLERAASAMRLHSQKNTAGSKLTIGLSKPDKKGYYQHTPEKLAAVMAYCKDDIYAELELHRAVRGLGPEERKVWLLDQTINERGVRLDMDFVSAAQQVVDQATGPLLREFQTLTGIDKLASPKLLEWANKRGANIPNLQKETIAKYLGEDDDEEDSLASEDNFEVEDEQLPLPFDCRRALEIRSVLGSASIKKLSAMRHCCGPDGRARGLLQYHGAGPGRWAGRLLQPQNFPRPTTKVGKEPADPGALVAAIQTGSAEYVQAIFGEPIRTVASSLRHAIIASDGNLLTVGDFATIECVIVLAIAGQHDQTAAIAAGKKPYIPMAEKIFQRRIDKEADLAEYTIGKNTVLGCGFQMGWKKFKTRYAPDRDDAFAKRCIDTYRKDFAPCVPKVWYGLEAAAVNAVHRGGAYEAYGVVYKLEEGWLTARLPSGRKLWYRSPVATKKSMPWDPTDVRLAFEYSAWKLGQWKTIQAYGGLLTENVVQALARDLLVSAMFRAEANGFPLVMTVHDELVADCPVASADPSVLKQIMCDVPQWARQLQIPVDAECWSAFRYRK